MVKPSDPLSVGVATGGEGKAPAGGKTGSGGASGPRWPPPPGKPNKLAELYRGGGEVERGSKGKSGDEGVAKDKGELQSSIRSLKEDNEALVDINKNLDQKLFKVRAS